MTAMLQNIWESPIVSQIAFHPQPATPSYLDATSGPKRDGTFMVSGGVKVCYRLHMPADTVEIKVVVFHWHGNAELCTDGDSVAEMFHRNGAALLSIDYRGFGWSTGEPSITTLCSDAEECYIASQQVLDAAGCGAAKRVMWGRSIGATCAVHIASKKAKKVHGLFIESGLLAIKELPMIPMIAQQMFGQQAPMMLQMVPDPHDTRGKLASVGCPLLVMHGDQDEIVPISQGVEAHDRCASQQKKLVRWPDAGHNNIHVLHGGEWATEMASLLGLAMEFTNPFPAGALVEAHSLNAEHLNGLQGRILGPQADRVRVQLPDPHGEKALKPVNLKLIDEGEEPAEGLFKPGDTVEAHSLSSEQLNGQRGKVTAWQGDRVLVNFPDHGEKALKPGNLKIVL
eukprot:gnl/TRDRNA2_/TRDRNA2_83261_c0_seq1.p1 gnl/TRDRNA2_/TRDRNA2_83261_c0~~gnl/TRDRNA2_/TRDRNA2_83261_c0_seq1.p1  ORF type:complete len:417 (-),score=88.75 gnl/TRDRNA2_/TRDRNA2_83261_c0_seq1:39-1232(-)